MSDGRPNLFLIGAMKSGTTYLRRLLHAHPAIFMSDPDEPSYFVEPRQLKAIWPEMWARGLWRSRDAYLQLFQEAGNATVLGEASTTYTKRPMVTGIAERIEQFNPAARFIYLLRDPIQRTLSHYWHMVRYHAEYRPMLKAIRTDKQYVAVSNYAMQLRPFLDRFGQDRIAVLTYESLVRDPLSVMQALYEWLGVATDGVDTSEFRRPEHVTPAAIRRPAWGGIPRRLWQARAMRGMQRYIPEPVENKLRRLTSRMIVRHQVDTTEVADMLRPIQLRQTDELTELLGRDFPEWTTLRGPEGESLPQRWMQQRRVIR